MKLPDLIFSNRLHYRFSRHLLFWFCCWLYFMVTFYVPFGVLPDWSVAHLPRAIKTNGSFGAWAERRVFHSLFSISSFVMVAYFVNYILLPKYLFRKKIWTGILIAISAVMFLWIAQAITGYIINMRNYNLNPSRRLKPEFVTYLQGSPRMIVLAGPILIGFFVAIKLGKGIWLKQRENEQIAKEKARAELSLLKSQVHPHFLFNTLNNIYYFTLLASAQAPVMIKKLSAMLRYIIYECTQSYVPLEGEIKMIEDYMALEKIRYGEQIKVNLAIEGDPHNKMIAPMLMIPLVENSFKHGASKMLSGQWVNLRIHINGEHLQFSITNNKPEQVNNVVSNGHVGLKNVRNRLELLYPKNHEFKIVPGTEIFSLSMKIHLLRAAEPPLPHTKSSVAYAME